MKVKKYVGETIQDTIFKVKADLGSEAIILNTRKYKKGGFLGLFAKKQVEVLAALEDKQDDKKPNNNHRTLQEINNLKNMINSMNQQWQAKGYIENLPDDLAVIYSHLRQEGVNTEIIRNIIDNFQGEELPNYDLVLDQVQKEIIDFIGEASPININSRRKVILLAGPTGVGKTTTIAKLAAKFALEKNRRVGLITADTYRIAAVQQLKTYSDIVNLPLKVVYNFSELKDTIINEYRDYDLILIDTAGSSWNDKIQLGRLKKFACNNLIDEVHLLVSLNTRSEDIKSIIKHFSLIKPDKLILSKLDETNFHGDLINLRDNYDLPYSYITFGQDVPDDIQVASSDYLLQYILGDINE